MGADFLSIFVRNIQKIFFNIAIFLLENFNLALHYNWIVIWMKQTHKMIYLFK